jgi:peptidyl-prolyl cis-trans isomerase A (cyclophilin A)
MKDIHLAGVALALFAAVCSLPLGEAGASAQSRGTAAQPQKASLPRVTIVTELGEIVVELEPEKAPITVTNFLRYMDAAYFDGGRVHRTVKLNPDNQPSNNVKIEVIQAGPRPGVELFPPIVLERTSKTGLRHKDGVISMGRTDPDTARGDFFICVGDQPSLDFGGARNPDRQGFAAFGRVVSGMDVVRKIHQSPVEAQRLNPPVRILYVRRRAL